MRRECQAFDRDRPAATGSNGVGEGLPPNGKGTQPDAAGSNENRLRLISGSGVRNPDGAPSQRLFPSQACSWREGVIDSEGAGTPVVEPGLRSFISHVVHAWRALGSVDPRPSPCRPDRDLAVNVFTALALRA